EMIRILHREAKSEPRIRIETGRGIERLLRDPQSMEIVGVELQDRSTKIIARRGVVLTAGGFSRNPEMVEQFAPLQAAAKSVGGPGNVGEGIKMAWHMGAGCRDMAYIKWTFGTRPDAKPEEHTAMMAIYKGAIAINTQGQRFVDE